MLEAWKRSWKFKNKNQGALRTDFSPVKTIHSTSGIEGLLRVKSTEIFSWRCSNIKALSGSVTRVAFGIWK